jgi:hypothetical protein
VTVGRTASGRFGGAKVHHATIESADRCVVADLPATTVARTLIDCAAQLGPSALNRLVDAAVGRSLVSPGRLRAAQRRAGPILGSARLSAALEPYTAGADPGSVAESHVLRLFSSWGLPAPETQYVIRDGRGRFVARVDFAWPRWRLALEYDGDEAHPPRAWAADDRRQERMEDLGWRVERADRGDLRPSATRLRTLLTSLLTEPA